MKKIKWSPALIIIPILTVLHTWWIMFCARTDLRILILLEVFVPAIFLLLFDRAFVLMAGRKAVWVVETIILTGAIWLYIDVWGPSFFHWLLFL